MSRKLLLLLAATTVLAACKPETQAPVATETPSTPASTHEFSPQIDEGDYKELVSRLASDEFEGRAPGSVGEDKTVDYIAAQFQRIGLQPGAADGSWYQPVPMMETTADESTVLHVTDGDNVRDLAFGTDFVLGTRTGQPEVKVDDSELVFVGYGVNAPEQDWNDYAGLDVKGKTVVILVNDPGFHAKDESLFEGRKMTYYGRWTYKFEEAARQGAAAALIVHDTEGASYGWDVVKSSWSGPQFDLLAADDPDPRLPAQGWITGDVATQLFADSGLDIQQMYAAANQRGFKAVPLKGKVSFDLKSSISEKASRNVIGVLPGTDLSDQAVLYMAHWDHLGKHEGEGDVIFNGAVDNATGVAGIIEIAGQFAAADPKPRRSAVFVAVTLEESGLLGSKYYVAHPTFPLDKIAGVVNIDAMSVAGRSRDLVVTGLGSSQLEDILKTYADQQGRTLTSEDNTAAGYYFRSDHFNFAKAGVPALYADGGRDLVEGGVEAGKAAGAEYAKCYHQACDEVRDSWKYDGIVQDLEALYGVGATLAGSDQWPNWYDGNPFKAARDAMMQAESAK
ncbi:aminopeptidase [Pseudoxanthomonas kalamensis DSM 18571]|uniref:M28 family metallopeptidase n=1 Tax=Pseudoxanthomonas kalamensis TaxID=289483 RepID=UPI0013918259|nr:M28 family metallopeptidase [Pseudoxanthomonas kalamensis]KAF1712176.1 aminopeptidase [Pseudoxanthomonas kalamensis DSM 18571]